MKRIIFSSAAAAALVMACGGGGSELAPDTTAAPTSTSSNALIAPPVGTSAAVAVPSATAAPMVPSPPVVTPALSLPATNQAAPAPVLITPPAAAGAVSSENSCGIPNFEASVLLAVNAARAQARTCGNLASPAVAALGWSQALMTAAASHSLDMAQRNYFSHTSPEGATTADRAYLAGYPFVALGENIAAGQSGVESVMKAWLGSPGHCLNIMSANYADIAVACVSAATKQYPTYWTMVLGKRP